MRMTPAGLAACALAGCATSSGGDHPATYERDAPGGAVDATTVADRSDAVTDLDPGGDAAVDSSSISGDARADAAGDEARAGWTLTWSDEFNGPDGSPVDPTKWAHDVGGDGWGNQEREYYTAGTSNAVVSGGNLVVTADRAGAAQNTCWYGPCQYTSARLLTKGLFEQQYGRIEARIQIPVGQGLWAAFWLLGSNIGTVSWPACGEIDVMENIGKEPTINHGSLHAPGLPGAGLTGQYTLAGGGKLSDAFHAYAVEWDASAIRFYVDQQLYETQTRANVPDGGTWAFDHPFFILLNVSVGGIWPGDPDGTTAFPQRMKVDWVRVYQKDGSEP